MFFSGCRPTCAPLRRREILIFALRTGGEVLTGTHVIFNYVTNVAAAVGNADKLTEILLKFSSPDYPRFAPNGGHSHPMPL